jgi:hypothetical protein
MPLAKSTQGNKPRARRRSTVRSVVSHLIANFFRVSIIETPLALFYGVVPPPVFPGLDLSQVDIDFFCVEKEKPVRRPALVERKP